MFDLHPDREAGLRRLQLIAGALGERYAQTRGFDFGPERRGNVSLLSPYIRHRLVEEKEVLAAAVAMHGAAAADKFVQEVFWRTYFKGWLEQHPTVWIDYRNAVARQIRQLDDDPDLLERYSVAIEGRSGIDCFDAWSKELVATGYLHNHARMWFASIWVFTLGLPWQLGADFFYRHLVDGDPASNTLSWRWVCGLHTKGKTYLARAPGIENYTAGRFNPSGQLASSATPLTESSLHPLKKLAAPVTVSSAQRFGLLITEEDCHVETLDLPDTPAAVIAATTTQDRSPLPVGDIARRFARGAVDDALRRAAQLFGRPGERADTADWANSLAEWCERHDLDTIATAHAPVGPVAERLAAVAEHLRPAGVRIVQLRRRYDEVSWPHARKGYFKLKKQIPQLLQTLGIADAPHLAHSKAS